ncbi:hypothetical protein QVD17_14801 [Tagetes erecta]|uniref:Benzyl alcohol O-benzoyltransferase n=1 Tax=Tagetes erecta TaxID=13708 RepID=A0AAD8KTN4_TARER|nr:hypothetical protein QVD17_14801 [Tagetes erecta]
MAEMDTSLTFTVRRHQPELVVPAKPTPQELKPLSDIDDQQILQFHVLDIQFYRGDSKMRNKNPASRLKEGPDGKLMVDCSGKGVLFIEGEADVTLDQFGDPLQPPFPCMEELLYDVPGSSSILDSPLILIQMTRLLCGGFIFAIRLNHTMSDGVGLVQFLSGLAEIARGATSPSILPVWQRELLCSSDRAHMAFTHHVYDHAIDTQGTIIPLDHMTQKSLFVTTTEISAFRSHVPIHLQNSSTFELLTACLWRCRTIALQPDPEEKMPIIWPVYAGKMFNPPLPIGYYGNVLAFLTANSTARDLCNKPLSYALDLVMKAKSSVTYKKYIRSASEVMAIKLQPEFITNRSFLVSDLTRAGLDAVDFGWGKAAYGGAAKGGVGVIPGISTLYVPYTNNKGEYGIVIPICLPSGAMGKFLKEVNNMLALGKNDMEHNSLVVSKL